MVATQKWSYALVFSTVETPRVRVFAWNRGINFGTLGFFDGMTWLCGWRWAEVSWLLTVAAGETILKTIRER
jgi:hypothetical protein